MIPQYNVRFFCEGIKYRLRDKKRHKSWIKSAILEEKKIPGNINLIFCDDEYILHLNRKYLDHDYYTDIIAFEHSEDKQRIEGDIYISIDRVKENASKLGVGFKDEIDRVIIHGILHMIGYNHKTLKDKKIMTNKEDYYLSLRY